MNGSNTTGVVRVLELWLVRGRRHVELLLFGVFAVAAVVGLESTLGMAYMTVLSGLVVGFLPGVALLRFLDVEGLPVSTYCLYAIGSSLFLVAVLGVLASVLGPEVGISQPLTRTYIGPLLSACLIVLWVLTPDRNGSSPVSVPSLSPRTVLPLGLLGLLLGLGAIALSVAPVRANNVPILVLLLGVITSFLFVAFDRIDRRLYPAVVFLVALAMIYQTSLVSEYVWGWDIQYTYANAERIRTAGLWTVDPPNARNPLVILVLLPAIFANVTGLPLDLVYKIVVPCVTAFIPVGIYWIAREFLDAKWSLLSAVLVPSMFLLFNNVHGKQQLGLFFMVGILLLFLSDLRSHSRGVLFICFTGGVVLSHYASSIVFLLVMGIYFTYQNLIWVLFDGQKPLIGVGKISLLGVFLVTWYMHVSLTFVFFNLTVTPIVTVQELLTFASSTGEQAAQSRTGLFYLTSDLEAIVKQLYRVVHMVIFGLVVIGGLSEIPDSLSGSHNRQQALVYGCLGGFMILLGITVVAQANLGIDRIYEWALLTVGPFAVLGWLRIRTGFDWLNRRVTGSRETSRDRTWTVLFTTFLIVLLLFNTGVVHYATETPGRSFPLQHPDTDYPEFNSGEISGSVWTEQHSSDRPIYADNYGWLLLSRSFARTEQVRILEVNRSLPPDACLFYRGHNIRGEVQLIIDEERQSVPLKDGWPSKRTATHHRVYHGSDSMVYCHP